MSRYPLTRREKPDFDRFLKVIRRKGNRNYVPFFELCIDNKFFEPLTGVSAPKGLDFHNESLTFEASFCYFLDCCARMGFDHGTINMCGFTGFPCKKHGVESDPRRGYVMAQDCMIANEKDFDEYPWPNPENVDISIMERIAKLAPEGLGVMTGGPAVFEPMCSLLGYDGISTMLFDNPGLVKRVADQIGSILIKLYDLAASLPFINGIVICGDMGFKTGSFVSPDCLREMVFPWHKRICEAIHRHGKICILHSCGNLASVMPDIINSGFDGKHSFEDTITPSFLDLQKLYGSKICLIGGIDLDFICRSNEDTIRKRVRNTIDSLASDGGYILGSGNSIPDYVPLENYWAMLDEGMRYGRPV